MVFSGLRFSCVLQNTIKRFRGALRDTFRAREVFGSFSLLMQKSHCGGQSMLTRRFETGEIGKRKPLSRARVHLASPLEGVYEFINVLNGKNALLAQ